MGDGDPALFGYGHVFVAEPFEFEFQLLQVFRRPHVDIEDVRRSERFTELLEQRR